MVELHANSCLRSGEWAARKKDIDRPLPIALNAMRVALEDVVGTDRNLETSMPNI